jgi:hypothetical protein
MVNGNITFDDYLGLNACLVEWADSYDSKDWDRLRRCIAPTLRVSRATLITTTPSYTHLQLHGSHVDALRSTTGPSSTSCGRPCRPRSSSR